MKIINRQLYYYCLFNIIYIQNFLLRITTNIRNKLHLLALYNTARCHLPIHSKYEKTAYTPEYAFFPLLRFVKSYLRNLTEIIWSSDEDSLGEDPCHENVAWGIKFRCTYTSKFSLAVFLPFFMKTTMAFMFRLTLIIIN